MSTNSFKSGRITNEETKEIIKLTEAGKTYEEIAALLGRKAETIKSVVEDRLLMNLSQEAQSLKIAEMDIRKSPEWKNLEKQLSQEEQDVFMHHWKAIVAQFENDITHTERLQIIDVVRCEILLNRVLEKINLASVDLNSDREELRKEMLLDVSIRDTAKVIDLQRKMGDINQAIGTLNKEYKELLVQKQSGIREIKGTREQRIRRVTDSKETITGWIASLMSEPEIRRKLGIHLEKIKLAQKFEYERLTEYHKYEDGAVEQPILNAESLKEDNF